MTGQDSSDQPAAGRKKFEFEEGKPALDRFTRTMKALFRVPKSQAQNAPHKPISRSKIRKAGS